MLQWLRRLFQFLFGWLRSKPPSDQKPDTALARALADSKLTFAALRIEPVYRKTNSLLTYQERRFYFKVLLREFANDFAIFMKVRLADLVWLANEPTSGKEYRNQIQCKHIDFVLCDKRSLEPVVAIELDDSSHFYPGSEERDRVKNEVCAKAGLPLYRVQAQRDYPVDTIKADVQRLLQPAPLDETAP